VLRTMLNGTRAQAGPRVELRFRCLGQFQLLSDPGRGIAASRKGGREFLQYLVAHPHAAVARETLIDAFWPDADVDSAAHRLHVAASGARAALRAVSTGVDPIWCSSIGYGWHRAIEIRTDVERFDECYRVGSLESFDEGARIYSGDYFAGETADWIVRLRLGYMHKLVTMLDQLAHDALARNAHRSAVEYASRLIAIDRAHEEATRVMMRCLAKTGQRTLAIAEYGLLRDYLNRYLGVDPTAETMQLRDCIARGEGV
jgi:DNA-binding SARP family transcriptional activator